MSYALLFFYFHIIYFTWKLWSGSLNTLYWRERYYSTRTFGRKKNCNKIEQNAVVPEWKVVNTLSATIDRKKSGPPCHHFFYRFRMIWYRKTWIRYHKFIFWNIFVNFLIFGTAYVTQGLKGRIHLHTLSVKSKLTSKNFKLNAFSTPTCAMFSTKI